MASWVRTSAPEKSVRAKAGARALTSVVTLAPPVSSRIVPGGAACAGGDASGFFPQAASASETASSSAPRERGARPAAPQFHRFLRLIRCRNCFSPSVSEPIPRSFTFCSSASMRRSSRARVNTSRRLAQRRDQPRPARDARRRAGGDPQKEPPEEHPAEVREVRDPIAARHAEEQLDRAEGDDEVLRLHAHRQHEKDQQRDHPLREEHPVGHQQAEDDPRGPEHEALAPEQAVDEDDAERRADAGHRAERANRRVPSRSSISEPNIQIASALKSRWNTPPWRKA